MAKRVNEYINKRSYKYLRLQLLERTRNNMHTNFEVLIQSKEQLEQLITENEQVILYFSSENCTVCHAVYPKLLKLMENKSIKVGKIIIDDLIEISGQLLVFSVPTILIMHEGKEILRESRFIDFNKITRVLQLQD